MFQLISYRSVPTEKIQFSVDILSNTIDFEKILVYFSVPLCGADPVLAGVFSSCPVREDLHTNAIRDCFLYSGSVAQLVEQRPFKPWVEGSIPSALTKDPKIPLVFT